MTQLPSNITFGTIVGQFIASMSDSIDEDFNPDAVPMGGTITFTPSAATVKNVAATPNPITIIKTPIVGVLDDQGYLCTNQYDPDTYKLRRGVILVATDNPNLNPKDWTWIVSYKLTLDGQAIASPAAHPLLIPSGSIQDLAEVAPISSSNGTPVIRGERGEPGDMTPIREEIWSNEVLLSEFPMTYIATLASNVTNIVLPSTPAISSSGTITFAVKQDAVGGRTINWPNSILWPEGIKPQPSPGANSVSLFHILWSGTQWLGMAGGKAFA